MLKRIFGTADEVLWLNGDELDVQAIFSAISATRLKAIFGKEIDYIEDQDGVLTAFEFKWNPNSKHKTPKLFLDTYLTSEFKIIHSDNLEDFLM